MAQNEAEEWSSFQAPNSVKYPKIFVVGTFESK